MDLADCEGVADGVYLRAGSDPEDPPGPVTLAKRWLGRDGYERAPRGALLREAQCGQRDGRWVISVREGLSPVRLAWATAHELAEVALACEGYDRGDVELVADQVAACIVAPRRAVRSVAAGAADRRAINAVSRAFITSSTCAALRIGEATGTPLAVVAPTLRVRGDEYGWPSEPEIRALARARRVAPGLARTKLRDDPRRVVLVAG